MSIELTVTQPTELTHEVTPMSLIEQASARGASIEQMQQLFDLQLRWEANEALKAYNASFSAFKAEAISIVKRTEVKDGPLKGKFYADLFGVVNAITPALSRHNLSHSWKLTKDEPAWIEVTCTIRHVLGHSESVSMGSAPDAGPGRNAIQARASATNYLERYSLLAATGMAAAGADSDGGGTSTQTMPETEYLHLRDSIDGANNADELKKAFAAAYRRAEATGDKQAMASFIDAKNSRKKGMAT